MAQRVKISEVRALVKKAIEKQRQMSDDLLLSQNADNPQVRELRGRIDTKIGVLEDVDRALRGDMVMLKILGVDLPM